MILLGDLNVSHEKLGLLGKVPDITYTVHGEPTNTRGSKSYDNIVFTRTATSEYTGQSGILNLQSEYGLSTPQALKVSDHQPVWAEFTMTEGGASTRFASKRTINGQDRPPSDSVATPPVSVTPSASSQNPRYETAQQPQRPSSGLTGWLRDRVQNDPGTQPLATRNPKLQPQVQPTSATPSATSSVASIRRANDRADQRAPPRRRRFGFRRSRLFAR